MQISYAHKEFVPLTLTLEKEKEYEIIRQSLEVVINMADISRLPKPRGVYGIITKDDVISMLEKIDEFVEG